jgi:large subunit ribosomal protein L23Ae
VFGFFDRQLLVIVRLALGILCVLDGYYKTTTHHCHSHPIPSHGFYFIVSLIASNYYYLYSLNNSGKAKAVSKALKKGISKKGSRIHTKTHFYKPKTLKASRKPKYEKNSTPKKTGLDAYSIIKYPLTTESSMKLIEDSNTLVFICDIKANKRQIKAAAQELYSIQCEKVNTLITPRGLKKAYLRLSKDFDALEVASNVGVI